MHFLLLLLSLTSSLTLSAQSDPAIKAIKLNTQTTAENTAKGGFDYITLTISLLAFFIACVTLYYSIKTYRSQKKTESNTTKFSAKQERIELRHLGVQLINNAGAFFVAEELQTEDNNLYINSQLYEGMLIDIDRLHTDTFMGKGIDHSGLYEFSIQVKKYNERLRLRKRMAECRIKKPETVKLGEEEYVKSQFYQEMEMTWNLFKQLCILYNNGMLTDEERATLIPAAQGAELPTYDPAELRVIEQVFDKLAKENITNAQQCAIETDLTYPYRIFHKSRPEPLDLPLPHTPFNSEKLFDHILLADKQIHTDTEKNHIAPDIHEVFMYSVINQGLFKYNREFFLLEERKSPLHSIITSYVCTEEGEYHTTVDHATFRLILDGTFKDIEFTPYFSDVQNMVKVEGFSTLSEPELLQILTDVEPGDGLTFEGDAIVPLSTLVLTIYDRFLLYTMRIKVLNHRLDFIKQPNEDSEGTYDLQSTLHLDLGPVLTLDHQTLNDDRYNFIQN